MKAHIRPGLAIPVTAVTVGVAGDTLLRATPWGINSTLWVAVLVGGALVVTRLTRESRTVSSWLLLALPFAAFLAWRDAPFLQVWDFFAVLAALTLAAVAAFGTRLQTAGVFQYCAGALGIGLSAAVGALSLAIDGLNARDLEGGETARRSRSAVIGVLLAVPLVLLFGALLASADPVFENVVRTLFDWDFRRIVSHLVIAGSLAWLAAGYLRGLAVGSPPFKAPVDVLRVPSLGIWEIGIALGLTTLIFLLFVVVQIEYLFGGEDLIRTTTGLSYAEYARRGFFELVAVATLVVPVLLGAQAMLDKRSQRDVQSFRALSTVILILVALIMASAVQRMRLYVGAYGLTQDRLYAAVFLAWVGTVLGLFAGTALFGSGRRFAYATIVSGFAFLAGLNALNPDALIARVNLARAQGGKPLDIAHTESLSADAVPSILAGSAVLEPAARCELLLTIDARWTSAGGDWRSWNFGRQRAVRSVRRTGVAAEARDCSRRVEPPATEGDTTGADRTPQ